MTTSRVHRTAPTPTAPSRDCASPSPKKEQPSQVSTTDLSKSLEVPICIAAVVTQQNSISQAMRLDTPFTLGLSNVSDYLRCKTDFNGEAFTVCPRDCRALACDGITAAVRNLGWERDPPEPRHPKHRFLCPRPVKHTQLGAGVPTTALSFKADPRWPSCRDIARSTWWGVRNSWRRRGDHEGKNQWPHLQRFRASISTQNSASTRSEHTQPASAPRTTSCLLFCTRKSGF